MIIRDIEAYSYVKWKRKKATPINDEILNTWTQRKKQRDWEHGDGKLFYRCFKQWQKGKVTPVNDKTRLRFETAQFRQGIFKSYGIGKSNGKYTIHHLFPQSIFPFMKFDVNNAIPLKWPIHRPIHERYSNPELAIDPITPLIEALELSIMEAK